MATFGEVLSWSGTNLRGGGEALLTAAKTYQEVCADLTELKADGLEGETAEAEARARRVLADDAQDIQTALESCGNDLEAAADSVDATRQVAEDIKTRAAGNEFSISDSGEVVDEKPKEPFTPATEAERQKEQAEREELRQGYQNEVTTLVEQAGDVVAYLEGVYDELAGLSSTAKGPSSEVISYGAHQPPASWSPQAVNDWWTSLTPAEQQHIINTHPSWVGNLDGVPMEARDQANQKWLAIMVEEVDKEVENYDGVKTEGTIGGLPNYTAEYGALLERQKHLHALVNQFNNAADGDKHTLLVLDATGDHFHAAVGTGDIDTADHVVVNTPGMSSTVASTLAGAGRSAWGNGVQGTDRMIQEAQWQLDRDGRSSEESVAGVTWLDYDAPDLQETASSSSVLSMNEAREGAPDLASFYDGVQATHQGDPHLVAAGHSYGSTVTGLAAEQSSAPDDLVVYGSPGLEHEDASDMGLLPRDHMFSATAEGDDVAASGWHSGQAPIAGGNIDAARDFTHVETDARPNPDYTGAGANGYKEFQGSSGHSEYTDREGSTTRHTPSTSLYNMGSVLAGNGNNVITK